MSPSINLHLLRTVDRRVIYCLPVHVRICIMFLFNYFIEFTTRMCTLYIYKGDPIWQASKSFRPNNAVIISLDDHSTPEGSKPLTILKGLIASLWLGLQDQPWTSVFQFICLDLFKKGTECTYPILFTFFVLTAIKALDHLLFKVISIIYWRAHEISRRKKVYTSEPYINNF